MRWPGACVIAVVACGGSGAPPGSGPSGSAPAGSHAAVPHTAPKELWSFDPQAYYADRDFLQGSAFSRDLAVIAKVPPGGSGGAVGIVALDPQTGKQLWKKDGIGWLVHPPHSTSPLFYAPLEKTGPYAEAYTHIDRLDPKTGNVLSSVKLQRTPSLDFELAMVWSRQALLAVERDTLVAYDWGSGAPLWKRPIGDQAYLFPPTIVGDRAFFPGKQIVVVSLADGSQLARIPGECCTIAASPDGQHVFSRAAVGESIEIGRDLTITRRIKGEILAASNHGYAVEVPQGNTKRVEIYSYDQPNPVRVLTPVGPDDAYLAVGLSERYVFYFHDADKSFAQQELETGKVEQLTKVGSHFVVSTEVVGSSPAIMTTPPIIERPYLFSEEWGVHGFLIGEE